MKEKAYVACGCFWGTQALFNKLPGIISSQVGYMGGSEEDAHYDLIKHGGTAHKEVLEIIYDPKILTYGSLLQYFFEIHDFSQIDGQGPDIGEQYTSVIFYLSDEQRGVTENTIALLEKNKYQVATKITPAMPFYPAEAYHQNYYANTGLIPYCHIHRPIFRNLEDSSER